MHSPRVTLPAALALCLLAFAGCAVRSQGAFLERGADVTRYQRYEWGAWDPTTTGDPRLDNNEIFQARVRAAVDTQLARIGFEESTGGGADVRVHFHASVVQRMDLTDVEQSQPCPECKPFIYDAGTLVVDLVDAETNRLIWRGWSEGNVDGVVGNQRWLEDRIDEAAQRIFDQFPRRNR